MSTRRGFLGTLAAICAAPLALVKGAEKVRTPRLSIDSGSRRRPLFNSREIEIAVAIVIIQLQEKKRWKVVTPDKTIQVYRENMEFNPDNTSCEDIFELHRIGRESLLRRMAISLIFNRASEKSFPLCTGGFVELMDRLPVKGDEFKFYHSALYPLHLEQNTQHWSECGRRDTWVADMGWSLKPRR